ncbi:MAG: zinc ribbon domain-containing protein [Anaerolineaceae bacterium]|nr:zinc ribbon domain-containing protein [Anaerolineaceae bacterium]
MGKIRIIAMLILCFSIILWGGEFEDTLRQTEQANAVAAFLTKDQLDGGLNAIIDSMDEKAGEKEHKALWDSSPEYREGFGSLKDQFDPYKHQKSPSTPNLSNFQGVIIFLRNWVRWLLLYISIPIVIRFVILRKPIKRKWIAIGILAPIFIVFSILLNVQRERANIRIYQELNMPHKPKMHMIGSPLLYVAMMLSFRILCKDNIVGPFFRTKTASSHHIISKCPQCGFDIKPDQKECEICGLNLSLPFDLADNKRVPDRGKAADL